VPFEFPNACLVGQVQVPLSHPAIVAMIHGARQATAPPGHLLIGVKRRRRRFVIAGARSRDACDVMMDA